MPFQSEKQKKWMWANKPEMAREWTEEYGSKVKAKTGTMAKDDRWIQKATKNMRKDKPCTGDKFGGPTCPKGTRRYNLAKTFRKMNKAGGGPVKAVLGLYAMSKMSDKKKDKVKSHFKKRASLLSPVASQFFNKGGPIKAGLGTLLRGLATKVFRKKGTAHADSSQAKIMGDPNDRLLEYFKTRTGSVGMQKEGKMIKAKHGEFVPVVGLARGSARTKRQVAAAEIFKAKGLEKAGEIGPRWGHPLNPFRIIAEGRSTNFSGYPEKSKYEKSLEKHKKEFPQLTKNIEADAWAASQSKKGLSTYGHWPKKVKRIHKRSKKAEGGTIIKAKKGSLLTTDLKGYKVDKVSKKTAERFYSLWRHRTAGGWKEAKGYKKHLKALKKMQTTPLSGTSTALPPKTARLLSNLQFVYKDKGKSALLKKAMGAFPFVKGKASTAMGKAKAAYALGKGDTSTFLKRKMALGVGRPTALAVGKTLLKRSGLGKAVLAATAVAGAYEAGKRKLFTKDKKKKVQKKSTGGEIVIGRGVDLDLL